MTGAVLRLAARMEGEQRPFALATVVRSERPTSGKAGNTALVAPDGTMHGWIGGSCTRSEVVRHALEALRLGESRLLAFGAADGRPDDLVQVPMSCASGGKVEVHINPVLPAPVLLVVGDSPVALALLRLGGAMGYRTVATASDNEEVVQRADDCVADLAEAVQLFVARPPGTRVFAVVATMGREDERSLAGLVAVRPDYMGVVASPKRMRSVRAVLAGLGLGDEEIGRIRGPAGLDIGAREPVEIALSILAEIVEQFRRPVRVRVDDGARGAQTRAQASSESAAVGHGDAAGGGQGAGDATAAESEASAAGGHDRSTGSDGAPAAAWATDPVCGMTVAVAESPSSIFQGTSFHFCCTGCRSLFEATPEAFASSPATGPA